MDGSISCLRLLHLGRHACDFKKLRSKPTPISIDDDVRNVICESYSVWYCTIGLVVLSQPHEFRFYIITIPTCLLVVPFAIHYNGKQEQGSIQKEESS